MVINYMPNKKSIKFCVFCVLIVVNSVHADDIQFNTEVLDVKERGNIDLSQFSHKGYILPGTYTMTVYVNEQSLGAHDITYLNRDDDPAKNSACLSPELVSLIGFKNKNASDFSWWNGGKCLDLSPFPGMTINADGGKLALYLSIPQKFIEYESSYWVPSSRWDNGIPGIIFDYNAITEIKHQNVSSEDKNYNVSANGTAGANLGPWRLRADWQGDVAGSSADSGKNAQVNRYYLYRAIPSLNAKLTLGENDLNSSLYDSFRFVGATLRSDDSMLPPNLRGYAPEVNGVAKTNARVTISQQGRIIYQTQVAAGPFQIQDLDSAVTGKLDVQIQEQDGTVQNFQVNTANIPYLTRPGLIRYSTSVGKPTDYKHNQQNIPFAQTEISWGVTNGWSLYGGGIAAEDYTALSLGVGRDLFAFGAISFDITQSHAQLEHDDETLAGRSYRVSYSKSFDEYNSQITFAGYRFSERNYMSLPQFLGVVNSINDGISTGHDKEMYTISVNKTFVDSGVSTYLSYNRQTYWNGLNTTRYNMSLSKYFDTEHFNGINASLSLYKSDDVYNRDQGLYLSFSMPLGNNGTVGYNSSYGSDHKLLNTASYNNTSDSNNYYSVSAGLNDKDTYGSASYYHMGDTAEVDSNLSYQAGQYSSATVTVRGGLTATAKGAVLHRTDRIGGTRLLVDTDGVAGIPLDSPNGAVTQSNYFGKAVILGISDFARSKVNIDVNKLPTTADVEKTQIQGAFTEGAIGYRKFDVISGQRVIAMIRFKDGTYPPFGANVINSKNYTSGIIGDDGSTYLTGVNSGEKMKVEWDGKEKCLITIPEKLAPESSDEMLMHLILPCIPIV